MSFEEKSTWLMLAAVVLVYGWYFLTLWIDAPQATQALEEGYRGLMLKTVVALVIIAVAGHIVIAVAAPQDADAADERDREINRIGEYIGGYATSVAALTGLGMALFEVPHFLVANAILLGLVISELIAGSIKIWLYRRGM